MLILVCMFLFKNILNSQNLIQNSSFENIDTAAQFGGGGFFDHTVWPPKQIVYNWNEINSPDYYTSNMVAGTYTNVPYNAIGTSYSKDGVAYAGLIAYIKSMETKEYISQQINTPLIHDSVYCLSFFISRADAITYSIKNIGAYFSITPPNLGANVYLNYTPQVINITGFLTDTIGWTEIQGCFTAQGGEQYVTIGNFNSNANTDTLFVGSLNPNPGANGYAYYYIDSVSLWQNSFPVGIKEQAKNEFVSVYPNPATDVITFKFADAIEKRRLKIKINDVIGREVLLSEFKEQLNISQLETGIYFVSVMQGNKTLVTRKVVKQ